MTDKKIMIFAPHADDAEIGMGGTIARYVSEGYEIVLIRVIIHCDGLDGKRDLAWKEKRLMEQQKAAEILGITLKALDLDPYEFSYNRENTKVFDQLVRNFSPSKIFTAWEHDSHQDHQILAKIICSACRKNNCSLYMYETMMPGGITSVGFNPQMYVNISNFEDQKLNSLKVYESVFSNDPEVIDGIINRAKFRGSQIGVSLAEAFEIIKDIKI